MGREKSVFAGAGAVKVYGLWFMVLPRELSVLEIVECMRRINMRRLLISFKPIIFALFL
jgi:hypothetical protein